MSANRQRARTLAAIGALALAMALALPEVATAQGSGAERVRFDGEVAFAGWFLDDPMNTSVHISAVDGDVHSPPGPPEGRQEVFVDVFQWFCDDDADELVQRNFFGFQDAPVDIDRGLQSASVDTDLTLLGSEFRTAGCDEPGLPAAGDATDLGSLSVDVAADWDGVGDLHRSRSMFHSDSPNFKIRSRNLSTQRDAIAHGVLDGLQDFDVPADLGAADFAGLSSVKDSHMFIGEAPAPPSPDGQ